MKKILLLTLVLILMCLQSFADTRATVLLLHNGQGISFDADQLQTAVETAIAGDTICLSEGIFVVSEGSLVIDKDVCIIGAGADVCRIEGNVDISIDGNPKLYRNILESIKITGELEITKNVSGVSLRKCWIGGCFHAVNCEAYDVKVNRCFLYQFGAPSSKEDIEIKSATVTNSIIVKLGHDSMISKRFAVGYEVNFINCTIVAIATCGWAATYTNCILCACWGNDDSGYIINNTFVNTLFNNRGGTIPIEGVFRFYNNAKATSIGNLKHSCYEYGFTITVDENLNLYPTLQLSEDNLKELGFLGNDGTVVGAYGGNSPYSLEADGIHIKESVLKVDPATRQLNVTLKVE